jgi:hypothetical protein
MKFNPFDADSNSIPQSINRQVTKNTTIEQAIKKEKDKLDLLIEDPLSL